MSIVNLEAIPLVVKSHYVVISIMDPNSNIPQAPVEPQLPPQDLSNVPTVDKKRLFIMLAVVAVLIILAVIIYMMMRSPSPVAVPPQDTFEEITPGAGNDIERGPLPNIPTPQPTAVTVGQSPEMVARNFYNWYVTTPQVLASGVYETRPEISDEYKEVMGRYASRGLPSDRDPVFSCGQYPLGQNLTSQEAQINSSGDLALVILTDPSLGNLYQIKLEKIGNGWLIRDVWCAPE